MGSRSHYAIISGGAADLRYSHWGAQHIDADLLWGPDVVIPFIENLDREDHDHVLLDATWSEGAVVLDLDHKQLLVSGGDTIGPDPELRRLWLRLAKLAWTDWHVDWAYHGISHVVDALGVERDRVLGKLPATIFDDTKLYACHTQGRARMLLSIRNEEGLEHYGFDAPVEYYLVAGERLIGCLDRCKIYSTAELQKGIKLPEDAIFIDEQKKTLVVTLAPVFGFYDPRITDLIKTHWPGWIVVMNYEGLRKHPEVAELDFRIPDNNMEDLLEILKGTVCIAPPQPAAAQTHRSTYSQQDGAVSTTRHRSVVLTRDERSRRFEELVSKLRS